jgi:hypothetical protein
MAFVFENGGSNLTLRNSVVAPACAPNCQVAEPSTTADAAHFSGVAGPIDVEGNDFGWNGDDTLNIHGLLIPAQAESRSSQPWLKVIETQWAGRVYLLTVGAKILFYDSGLTTLGSATVLAVDPASARFQVSSAPTSTTDLIVTRADGVPSYVTVSNNYFHDHRARGILMGGSQATVANNTIERVTMEAILIDADADTWYEGPGAQHVTITGNHISNVNRNPDAADYPAAISAGVVLPRAYTGKIGSPIQDIHVDQNALSNLLSAGSTPVFFGRGVSGAEASGNQ